MLQTNAFEIGLGICFLGLLKLLYRFIATKNQLPLEADVIDIKRKTRKSRRYTYPVVEIVLDDGSFKKINCSTAKRHGHSYYDDYSIIEMFKVRNILGKIRYIPVIGYWYSSMNIVMPGIAIIVISFFV